MKKDFEWIQKVIESCENDFHIECACRLIELFCVKYMNGNSAADLKLACAEKYNVIHGT